MAVWQEQAGAAAAASDMTPAEASRVSGYAGLWMLACIAGVVAEMVWRSNQIAGWAASKTGPSFWYPHHRPGLVILGLTVAACFLPRVAFTNLRVRLPLMCAMIFVGAAAAMVADRAYYSVSASQVVVRPSAPWKPDVRFSLTDAIPVARRCYQSVNRGSLHNRVAFEVRYSGAAGSADVDLGQGVRPANAGRWLAAIGDAAPSAGAGPAATIPITPGLHVTYQISGNEPACMARYLSALDAPQQARFKRLLE